MSVLENTKLVQAISAFVTVAEEAIHTMRLATSAEVSVSSKKAVNLFATANPNTTHDEAAKTFSMTNGN